MIWFYKVCTERGAKREIEKLEMTEMLDLLVSSEPPSFVSTLSFHAPPARSARSAMSGTGHGLPRAPAAAVLGAAAAAAAGGASAAVGRWCQ